MPWATVYDNVYLPLRLKGKSRKECDEQIRAALDMVDLADFANIYPRQLSGGMKMRCSIARALITQPKLVLMDEPFAALDELTRFRLNDDLLSLWDRFKWTAIFVTHSVFEATYLSSRTFVFSPRISRVFAEVPIDVPYPRSQDLRTDTNFQHIARQSSQMLSQAQDA